MIGKKLVAFVFSPTGSSLKIVKRLSKHFESSDIIDLTTIEENLDMEFDDETVVFAFPVYAGRVPEVFLDRLDDIYGNENEAIIIAVYGNRHYDDALLEISDMMIERDFKIIAAAAFVAEHTYTSKIAGGRPNEADLEVVDSLADVLELMSGEFYTPPDIPGNRPYRKGVGESTWAPYPSDKCISCGVCSMVCPVRIINPDGELPKEKIVYCLHCMACVKRCPINVRIADDEALIKLRAYLEENFTKPEKEPEIFL